MKSTFNRAELSERQAELFNQLLEYFGDKDSLASAILNNDDKLENAIHEIAESNVSIYTSDRLDWLSKNLVRADQASALASGAKNLEEIAAFCWYDAEYEDLQETINAIRELNCEATK